MIQQFINQLADVTRHLGWVEVIDVVVVAFVLYNDITKILPPG